LSSIYALDDIKKLVDAFYAKVREDTLLGPIFNKVIQDKWPEHLEKLYCFWQTVLLEEHTYYGSPFSPHLRLPVEKEHFDRWLSLFDETLDDFYTGEKVTEAKWRASKMAEMFYYKIDCYRNNTSTPIL
jgi:hemoglobin